MEIATADSLVTALMEGKVLVQVEQRVTHREEPLQVALDRLAGSNELRLWGWSSSVYSKAEIALSVLEQPSDWRVK